MEKIIRCTCSGATVLLGVSACRCKLQARREATFAGDQAEVSLLGNQRRSQTVLQHPREKSMFSASMYCDTKLPVCTIGSLLKCMYMKIHSCCTCSLTVWARWNLCAQLGSKILYAEPMNGSWKLRNLRLRHTERQALSRDHVETIWRRVLALYQSGRYALSFGVVDCKPVEMTKLIRKLCATFLSRKQSQQATMVLTKELWTRLLCFFFSFLQSPVSCCDDSWSERLWFYSPGTFRKPDNQLYWTRVHYNHLP